MITPQENQYLIDILVQHNAQLMKRIDEGNCTPEEIQEIKQNLNLSESIFQKVVTLISSDQTPLSIAKRVLVVDDIVSMRSILQALLQSIGFQQVDTAKDGSEAWAILQRSKGLYGLVVSDWEMPNMGGIELLKLVRGNEDFKELPFIIVSATNRIDKVQLAIKEGVTDYLTKPISEKMLKSKLQSYLR